VESSEQVFAPFLVKVEEQVFLTGKVIEDRHPGDIGGLGDLVHRYFIKPALEEEAGCDIGDLLPCGESLPCLAIWR
jgi:hypothetical protein